MNKKLIELKGKTFGKLIVLHRADKGKWGHVFWDCRCLCGNLTKVDGAKLRYGLTKSCGCLRHEGVRGKNLIHGDATDWGRAPLYNVWLRMKARCFYKKSNNYPYYGGKGIKVCNEWKNNYMVFKKWALVNGYQNNLTIDRINSNGDYKPSNCQWLTKSENSKKRWREQRKRTRRTLSKQKAIEWIIDTKAISPFTRNFVEWLYENNGAIVRVPREWVA